MIGAGFSGAMVAAHLLRQRFGAPRRIVLINRSGPAARGVAYGTHCSRHVLNVPAGRMSAFEDDDDHFLRYAQKCDPSYGSASFVPRRIYGRYLASILEAAAASAPCARLEYVQGEAAALRPQPSARNIDVELSDGRRLAAAHVVLALGNYAPSNPPSCDGRALASARYLRDPWAADALASVPSDQPVLLIGTGLTMLDVALELSERGHRGPMVAVSRRGLTPLPHREHGMPPSYAYPPPELGEGQATTRAYFSAVRRHVRRLATDGIDWREVIASLRPLMVKLWQALPAPEKSRFLRHLRPYWDVHRHRVAPEIWRAFEALRTKGSLQIRAARLLLLTDDGTQMRAAILPRGASNAEDLHAGMVINCTGPQSDVRSLDDTLLRQVIRDGLARPDPTGLGLDVAEDLALIERDGRRSARISLVGPLLKGAFWEATAVPELRVHAARLADRLCAQTERLPGQRA